MLKHSNAADKKSLFKVSSKKMNESGDLYKNCIFLYCFGLLNSDRFDDAGGGSFDLIFHFHRFKYDHPLSGLDQLTFRDQNLCDFAWHGRSHEGGMKLRGFV